MAGRTCSKCHRPAVGRGLCVQHHRAFLRDNPGAKISELNRKAIKEAMPGSIPQLMAETGLHRNTVDRVVALLRKDGECFIGDFDPPKSCGGQWVRIFHAGQGVDKRLRRERKQAFHDAGRIKSEEKRQQKRRAKKAVAAAGWAAALMI